MNESFESLDFSEFLVYSDRKGSKQLIFEY